MTSKQYHKFLTTISERYNPKTIYDIIRPLQRGSDYIETSNIPILTNQSFGFDIVLGDTRLSLSEDFLSSDWIDGQSGSPRGLKTTFLLKIYCKN